MNNEEEIKLFDEAPTDILQSYFPHETTIDSLEWIIDNNNHLKKKAIFLNGMWGSGKTTVLNELARRKKEEYKLISFDAWEGESDLFKKEFLKELYRAVFEKKDYEKNKSYKKIDTVKKEIIGNIPKFTIVVYIAITFGVLFLTRFLEDNKIFQFFNYNFIEFRNDILGIFKLENSIYISIAITAIIISLCFLIKLLINKRHKIYETLLPILNGTSSIWSEHKEGLDIVSVKFRECFEDFFQEYYSYITYKKCKTFIMSIDNLDRLSNEGIRNYTDALYTFMETAEKYNNPYRFNIWFIIAIDKQSIIEKNIKGEKDFDINALFFDKISPYSVDLPQLNDETLKQYLRNLLNERFEILEDDILLREKIGEIYNYFYELDVPKIVEDNIKDKVLVLEKDYLPLRLSTPRTVKKQANQIISIYKNTLHYLPETLFIDKLEYENLSEDRKIAQDEQVKKIREKILILVSSYIGAAITFNAESYLIAILKVINNVFGNVIGKEGLEFIDEKDYNKIVEEDKSNEIEKEKKLAELFTYHLVDKEKLVMYIRAIFNKKRITTFERFLLLLEDTSYIEKIMNEFNLFDSNYLIEELIKASLEYTDNLTVNIIYIIKQMAEIHRSIYSDDNIKLIFLNKEVSDKILDKLKKEDFEVQDGVYRLVDIIRNINDVKNCLVVFIHSSKEKYENILIDIYNYYASNLSENENIRYRNCLIIDSLKIIDETEIKENKKYKDIFKPYGFTIEIVIKEFNEVMFGEYQNPDSTNWSHSYFSFKKISQNSKSEIFNDERLLPNIQTIKQRLINNNISLLGSSSAEIWNHIFFDLYMANKESNKLLNNEEIGNIIAVGLKDIKEYFYVSFFIYFDIYFSQGKDAISSKYTDVYVEELFKKEYSYIKIVDPNNFNEDISRKNETGSGKYLVILIQSIYKYKDDERYGYNNGKDFSMKNIVEAVFGYISKTITLSPTSIEQSLFEQTINGFRKIYGDNDEFVGHIVKQALDMGIKYVPTSLISLFKKYSDR